MHPKTTDPYDALGFDPAPGDPASVDRLVVSLTGTARQLDDAHATLTKLGKAEGAWTGDGASAFASTTGSLPRYLNTAHDSLLDAAHALRGWEAQLTEFQYQAHLYEQEAEASRSTLAQARADPDLRLAGRTFTTQAELDDAQRRLDHATRRVTAASADLDAIIEKARQLQHDHQTMAHQAAQQVRKAAEAAPDKTLLDKLKDALDILTDRVESLAGEVWKWVQDHADDIYEIGDWLGYASAACDVLAVVFSETLIGAVVFEGIGMALNSGALLAHGVGWAAGSKKGNWTDIGLDLAGFIPFGDFARVGKIGKGTFTGVKIPMSVNDFGVKAADSWKRAHGIVEQAGGTAKLGDDAEKWVMRNVGALGRESYAIHITADTLADRFKVAVAKELGDRNLYRPGAGFSDKVFQKLMPKLIEHTPLGRVPGLSDSVRPIVDGAGQTVGRYIDPRSWTARGYEAALGAKHLYAEGTRLATEEVQFASDQIHEKYDEAREKANGLLAAVNPLG
ncbi:putative T7SS-secreted protein [Streptomyces sp. S6]